MPAGSVSDLRFELYRDTRREYRWRLKAANGKVLARSNEGYRKKVDCRSAITRIREDAGTATVDDRTG